jgi:hypothetical protein
MQGRVSSALQETPVICQVQLYSGMKSIVNEHALLAQSNGLGRHVDHTPSVTTMHTYSQSCRYLSW